MRAIIFGLAAERLSVAERRFFQAVAPAGFILFKRNCQAPAQLRALTDALRDCLGWSAPILIDQEGGRVQRLAPPVWAARPAPGTFRAMADVDPAAAARAAYLNAAVIAAELAALGVDVNCVPDLDLAFPQAAPAVVGDRSYGDDPARVSALGRAVAEGTLAGGALPVIKHLPGHGRGAVDSHFELPLINATAADLQASDFLPFQALADLPLAMTGHLLIPAYDEARPVTTSLAVIDQVIRGEIGFDGLLMSDDLSMQALSGTVGARAADCLAAGCDVALHCNGDLDEMAAVADQARDFDAAGRRRFDAALARRPTTASLDVGAAAAELADLMPAAATA